MKNAVGAVQSLLVLGGGSDIGMATARKLCADRTRTVILAGRHPEALADGAEELRAAGATTVDVVQFDADDTASHRAVIDDVFDRHGDIDVVLVAFGLLGDPEQALREPDEAVALLRTNVVGAVSASLHAVHRLEAQGHGTLVVLSSVAGERVRRANLVYGASKAAVDGFSTALGDELAGSGVDVVTIRPGFVTSKMTEGLKPPPLSATPDEVADAVVAGIRRGTTVVWVPGPMRWLMVVLRHLPRPVFRRLPF